MITKVKINFDTRSIEIESEVNNTPNWIISTIFYVVIWPVVILGEFINFVAERIRSWM